MTTMYLFGIIISSSLLLVVLVMIIEFLKDQRLLKTVTEPHRGTRSERKMVLKLLKSNMPAQTIFHDLYLINPNGSYSQIDLAVATKVGIIVFEIKEYSGWIFGTGNQKDWTKVLAYGKEKYRFYNPILQNKKHITDLIGQLTQFKNVQFYSVIVFFGNCEFKNMKLIPDDVFLIKSREVMDVIKKILLENKPSHYTDKREVLNLLKMAVKNGEDNQIREKHIKNIKTMLSKDTFN
jgi:hypothetical protein